MHINDIGPITPFFCTHILNTAMANSKDWQRNSKDFLRPTIKTRLSINENRNPAFQLDSYNLFIISGKTGIRTLGTVARSPHFECGPIDHSGIFPSLFQNCGAKVVAFMISCMLFRVFFTHKRIF